jgi:hypothetical protein
MLEVPEAARHKDTWRAVIGLDETAGVWIVKSSDIPGLYLEAPHREQLVSSIAEAVHWLLDRNVSPQEWPSSVEIMDSSTREVIGEVSLERSH